MIEFLKNAAVVIGFAVLIELGVLVGYILFVIIKALLGKGE